MKITILAETFEIFYWISIGTIGAILYLSLSGCTQFVPIPIGNGLSVDTIKIEPSKSKSIYRVERWI